jgi:competence protein ComEC
MLLDGGGMIGSGVDLGQRVLLPELAARRRRRVDVVVITHPHPDHYLGLVTSLPQLEVGEVWDSGLAEAVDPGGDVARLLGALRDRHVPLVRPAALCGAPRWFGSAEVDVIAPCPGFDALGSLNDNSLVLRIRMGRRTALLTGDAEEAAERALVDRVADGLRADLLKVGHHGSRTSSTPGFLDRVRPRHAVISAGVRNRFGHPYAGTLAALHTVGAEVFRTDRDGAILWWTDGEQVGVERAWQARRAGP